MDGNSHRSKEDILSELKGKMIVSCQGVEENIFYTADDMVKFAETAYVGGARAFRVNSPAHVKSLKKRYPDCPVIGINKNPTNKSEVFITPTIQDARELVDAGCDVLALDGTHRVTQNGIFAWENICELREIYPDILIMADIATVADAVYASKAGADIIATTLNGYTQDTKEDVHSLNTKLIEDIRKLEQVKYIIAEGRIWNPQEAIKAFEAGADSIVVGSAITSPTLITRKFIEVIDRKSK